MDLAKIIVPSKTVSIDYPGFRGFTLEIAYLTKDELLKIRDKAKTQKLNRKTRQMDEEVDADLFQTLYIERVIKGWTGLKYSYLRKMIPVDLSEIKDPENEELEYSVSNAEVLMKNCTDFDSWITGVIDDVENFTQDS